MSHPLVEAGKATRFQPGHVANPTGRPKARPLTDEVKKLLRARAAGSPDTNAQRVAWTVIQRAIAGDMQAARLLWEYLEGKPVQRVDLDVAAEARRLAEARGLDVELLLQTAEAIANGHA